MNTMKILLIEDAEEQQTAFEESVAVFEDKNDLTIKHKIVENIPSALKELEDGSYDGVIIDLVLGNDEEGGNKIVRQLRDPFTRIPIIFVTAFVNEVNDHPSIIRKRSRDDGTYESDLTLFQEIYNTGLTRIMRGRGIIEEHLTEVFLNNLLPQRKKWMSYGQKYLEADPERTEKALLRYALNHLSQLLEDDEEEYFPEEVYLYPPMSEQFTTGSVVKEKTSDQPFVILNPACDLVIRRNGKSNTDYILLVEIESIDDGLEGRNNKGKRESLANNNRQYRHWLPPSKFFKGGVVNFRKLKTLHKEDFKEQFEKPCIQISSPFVKDIVSRFSTYYARQGQPEIDNKDFIDNYTQQQS